MPIIENTQRECFERFRKVLAGLLASTIHKTCPVLCIVGGEVAGIGFQRGSEHVAVPLETDRFEGLSFFVLQTVGAFKIDGGPYKKKYQLKTLHYSYRIEEEQEPLVRWEYKTVDPAVDGPPRHHVHLDHKNARKEMLDFDKLHIPAWVTIEEVVRFAIHELGHRPPCGDRWPKVLAESEQNFYEKLSSKGCPRAHRGECPL